MSNARDLRRHTVRMIEDELFTLRTEIDNMQQLIDVKYEMLKNADYAALKRLRERVQQVQSSVKYCNWAINQAMETLPKSTGVEHIVDCTK